MDFDEYVAVAGPRLRHALVAAYGLEIGVEAAAEAMAYAWEHWDRLVVMDNPTGYLYRVGQTSARSQFRRLPTMPAPPPSELPLIEPRLAPALASLSEMQRTCVLLVNGMAWRLTEVAALLGISESSVRTHIKRGLTSLRTALEVTVDER